MKIDGERVVNEALRSIRDAERTIRERRRAEAGNAPAERFAAPAAEPAAAPKSNGMQPPAGLGETIVNAALRTRHELARQIAGTQSTDPQVAEASRQEAVNGTIALKSELGDEIYNFAKSNGIEASNEEIGDATRGLQIEIKSVIANVSGLDGVVEALGGVFDDFLSGVRELLGFAAEVLADDGLASPAGDTAAPQAAPDAAPSTVAPAFHIAIPASELPTPAQPSATADPAVEAPGGAGAAFAISSEPLTSAAVAAAAAEAVDAGTEVEVDVEDARTQALEGLFDRLRESFAAFQSAFFGSSGSPFGFQAYSETLNRALDADDDTGLDASA